MIFLVFVIIFGAHILIRGIAYMDEHNNNGIFKIKNNVGFVVLIVLAIAALCYLAFQVYEINLIMGLQNACDR